MRIIDALGAIFATVKNSSSAAVAADTALVVAVSPNNVVRVGDGTTPVKMMGASVRPLAGDAGALLVTLSPNLGASQTFILNSIVGTNVSVIKGSAAALLALVISNRSNVVVFAKFYNIAALPTVGTTVPVMTLEIPVGQTINPDFGTLGISFTSGLGMALTQGAADTDSAGVPIGVKVLASFA